MKYALATLVLSGLMAVSTPVMADKYKIDKEGAHAFIQFRVKHLGISWLYGRFNDFDGEFTFDSKDPSKNSINVDINVASVDTNHARRDKHLRSADFLDVKKHPKAKFVSTSYKATGPVTGTITGDLTLHGVTKPIDINVHRTGMGEDPWGGYRVGFEGRTQIKPGDWGIDMSELGKDSEKVEIHLTVEGIRQDGDKSTKDTADSKAKDGK